MNRKIPLIAFVALSGALAAGLAQARDADLRWSVTIGAPIYEPRVVPVQVPPSPAYGRPGRGFPPAYVVYREPRRWDVDGDGIPNRYDRLYNPRWDVDGDGIPNRRDRDFRPRHDRDGDGVPNRYDAWPDRPGRGHGR